MEVDTGACISLMSEQTFRSLYSRQTLKVQLRTYSGESIATLGEVEVTVSYKNQRATLPLVVVTGSGPSLLGRNWLTTIHLDWKSINMVQGKTLTKVLDSYQEVFEEELGKLKGHEAKIHVNPGAQPCFCKARPVPYAMRSKVEAELERLVLSSQFSLQTGLLQLCQS